MGLKDCKVGLYEKALPKSFGWKQKIKEAKAAGYDFIEISIDETDEKIARCLLYTSNHEAGRDVSRACGSDGIRNAKNH